MILLGFKNGRAGRWPCLWALGGVTRSAEASEPRGNRAAVAAVATALRRPTAHAQRSSPWARRAHLLSSATFPAMPRAVTRRQARGAPLKPQRRFSQARGRRANAGMFTSSEQAYVGLTWFDAAEWS